MDILFTRCKPMPMPPPMVLRLLAHRKHGNHRQRWGHPCHPVLLIYSPRSQHTPIRWVECVGGVGGNGNLSCLQCQRYTAATSCFFEHYYCYTRSSYLEPVLFALSSFFAGTVGSSEATEGLSNPPPPLDRKPSFVLLHTATPDQPSKSQANQSSRNTRHFSKTRGTQAAAEIAAGPPHTCLAVLQNLRTSGKRMDPQAHDPYRLILSNSWFGFIVYCPRHLVTANLPICFPETKHVIDPFIIPNILSHGGQLHDHRPRPHISSASSCLLF
jgi:hypothetical protein